MRRRCRSIRADDWKLIEHYEDGRLELFHLSADPSEEHDLAAQEPRRVNVLKGQLARWRKSVDAQENSPNENFDPAAYKRLYEDFDTSKLKFEATAAAMTPKLRDWRAGMDSIVPKTKK